MQESTVFRTLNAVNCNEHTEKKGRLTYLSWAWAWQIVKTHYPDAAYTVYESPDGWNYFTDGRTCWVKTGVTIRGLEHIEYLPVMDARNQSIPFDSVTSTDVNKAIQRSLTKACARHGLGLYIYAGEDLPDVQSAQAPQHVQSSPSTRRSIPFRGRGGAGLRGNRAAHLPHGAGLEAEPQPLLRRFRERVRRRKAIESTSGAG